MLRRSYEKFHWKNVCHYQFICSKPFCDCRTFFGWQTTITATDGVNNYSQSVSTSTFPACEFQRQNIIASFLSMGYLITSQPGCTPVGFVMPEKLILWPELRWPWPGPVCLSCPYLTKEFIHVIYPQYAEKVINLVDEYNIERYNAEVLELQKKFNLQGFTESMYEIEMQQQFDQHQYK